MKQTVSATDESYAFSASATLADEKMKRVSGRRLRKERYLGIWGCGYLEETAIGLANAYRVDQKIKKG